jgi:hypothetical protein
MYPFFSLDPVSSYEISYDTSQPMMDLGVIAEQS